jgi:predicted deacetylase
MIPGPQTGRDLDGARSARLMFAPELNTGLVHDRELDTALVRATTRVRDVPSRPLRFAQQVGYKLGRLDFERQVVAPLVAARRSVLGSDADGPPRFLVRVDEFPHYRAWDNRQRFGSERFQHFHEIMSAAGVPYLLAVLPRVSREPLTPIGDSRPLDAGETAMLARLASERVTFALHGLTHRTRFASPRRHSELCGLSALETAELLDTGLAELASHGVSTDTFVPPFNRFDADQFAQLEQRFRVVCGGPESIGQMGLQSTPQWRGQSVYLPSYRPFYGRAAEVLPAVEHAIEAGWGLWLPVVLHWGWEADAGWADLERLASVLAMYSVVWEEFIAAVERSKDGEPAYSGEHRRDSAISAASVHRPSRSSAPSEGESQR